VDFFSIGIGEILLVLVVAMIIWGPSRIVEVGRTLGKWVHTLRKAAFDLTTQVTKEAEVREREKEHPPQQYKSG
tara:strand:+ start:208 stop:429 length:222 start_codon:yes stop_codon:yes gene_type:complete